MINNRIQECWKCISSSLVNLPSDYSDTIFANRLNAIDVVCLLGTVSMIYMFGSVNLEKAEKMVNNIEKTLNTDEFLEKKFDKHDFIMAFIGRVMRYYSFYVDFGGIESTAEYDRERLNDEMLDRLSRRYLEEIKYIYPDNYEKKRSITLLCKKVIDECDNLRKIQYSNRAYNIGNTSIIYDKEKPQFRDVIESYFNGDVNKEGNLEFQFNGTDEFIKYTQIIADSNVPNRNDVKSIIWSNGKDYYNLHKKGFELFEQKRHKEAIETLEQSLMFNPIGIDSRFEIATNYMVLDELQNAKQTLLCMKDLLITNSNVATFYRLFGSISCREEKYNLSYACYFYSKQFELSNVATNEILYLSLNYKIDKYLMKCYTSFDYCGVEKLLLENNIPIIEKKEVSFDETTGKKSAGNSQTVDIEDYDQDSFNENGLNNTRH